jgi:hypothetical protein
LARRDNERGDDDWRWHCLPIAHLFTFVEINRIYLPAHICTLLDKLFENLKRGVSGLYHVMDSQKERLDKEKITASIDALVASQEILDLREALEVEFRALLGDVSSRLQRTDCTA